MRRRQINLMRAAVAPVAAHPSAPVEHPQQPAAVSVPPAPPPALLQRMVYEGHAVIFSGINDAVAYEGLPVVVPPKRKARRARDA